LVSVGRPGLDEWIGRSLGDLVAARGGHPSDVMADWLLENDLEAGIVLVGLANDDPDGVAETLASPAAMVGSSDAGAHISMVCTAGDTTVWLSRHARDRRDVSVEAAVAEITGKAASLIGLDDRGVVRVGARADLTVFDLDRLELRTEQLVDDVPGGGLRFRREAQGYRATVVNGVTTLEDGEPTGALPGGALRHPSPVAVS
jgi:N-acyl-D-aspartate/D-glutamate deacylase